MRKPEIMDTQSHRLNGKQRGQATFFTDRLDFCANGVFTRTGYYVDNRSDIDSSVKNGQRAVFKSIGFGNFVRFNSSCMNHVDEQLASRIGSETLPPLGISHTETSATVDANGNQISRKEGDAPCLTSQSRSAKNNENSETSLIGSSTSNAAPTVQPTSAACPQSLLAPSALSKPKVSPAELYARLLNEPFHTSIEPPILKGNRLRLLGLSHATTR